MSSINMIAVILFEVSCRYGCLLTDRRTDRQCQNIICPSYDGHIKMNKNGDEIGGSLNDAEIMIYKMAADEGQGRMIGAQVSRWRCSIGGDYDVNRGDKNIYLRD